MPYASYKPNLALKEHLLDGNRLAHLEAILLFGVQNFAAELTRMKRDGFLVKSERVPLAKVLRRANEYENTICRPPKELPIREIIVTGYWISN